MKKEKTSIWVNAITIVFALLFAVGAVKALSFEGTPQDIKDLFSNDCEEQSFGAGIDLDEYFISGSTASTSPIYMTTSQTASTTIIMSVKNAKHIDLNLYLNASTTASNLLWTYWFSSDDGLNKNWYPEDAYTATSNVLITHGASPLVHSWTPADSSATSTVKNIGITPVASKYMKIEFGLAGANGSLHAIGISQVENN